MYKPAVRRFRKQQTVMPNAAFSALTRRVLSVCSGVSSERSSNHQVMMKIISKMGCADSMCS